MIAMIKEEKDRLTLVRSVEGKLRQLLPDYGDRVFIKNNNNTIVSKVSHTLPDINRGNSFVCLTADGEISLTDMKKDDLNLLADRLAHNSYTFTEPQVLENRLRPNINADEYKQAVKAAKQAYHDRIVTPFASHFTPGQIDALIRLRTMFTEDSSTIGLFYDLAMEVGREPDIIRKPEKWHMEAFKELMDLGQEITIEIANGTDYQRKNNIKQAEAAAKKAIRERITNSWQRTFSPNQAFDLSYYAGLFSDVIPSELFKHLYEDVIKDPDVARKPEKWQTDTLKELNDLAEGITRIERQGMRI